jgi:CubicO group peptidase (beta-lactamase class C family)
MGFLLLGNIVEQVSKERLDRFVNFQVFRSLGITGSFNLYEIDPNRLAVLYRYQNGAWTPTKDYYPDGRFPPFSFEGYILG